MPKKKTTPAKEAKITQAEWEVMQILWNAGDPLPAAAVIDILEDLTHWKPKTIRTFLDRLVQKGALEAIKLGPPGSERLHYVPLLDEVVARRAERESFLGRFFGGTIRSMLASCIQSGEISNEELLELREMVDRQVNEQKGDKP